jgi:hypothetical protein
MSTALQNILGTAFIVAIVTASLQLTGCSTGYNSWTPRNDTSVEAYYERSCASGYYECATGSRGGRGGGGGEGAKK